MAAPRTEMRIGSENMTHGMERKQGDRIDAAKRADEMGAKLAQVREDRQEDVFQDCKANVAKQIVISKHEDDRCAAR